MHFCNKVELCNNNNYNNATTTTKVHQITNPFLEESKRSIATIGSKNNNFTKCNYKNNAPTTICRQKL